MMPLLIHILPANFTVCGGVKVHVQLSELEKGLGFESFIAFPDSATDSLAWFKHSGSIISYTQAKQKIQEKDSSQLAIVIGWEEIDAVREFSADRRVCYIQGESLIRHSYQNFEYFRDFEKGHIWYSSRWNARANKAPVGPLVSPYLDFSVFHSSPDQTLWSKTDPIKLLICTRKAGRQKWAAVANHLRTTILARLQITFWDDSSEELFATALRSHHIFFTHSSPEGLGLPALEAMASRCLVVGYTGGGGTDFMQSPDNCLMSPNNDAKDVAYVITYLAGAPFGHVAHMLDAGAITAAKYTKERTQHQLMEALDALL